MVFSAKNKILMVTGYSGSGKSELSGMLREEFDGTVLNVGEEMRSSAKNKGFGSLHDFIHATGISYGFGQTRELILDKISELYKYSSVIIDGVYDHVLPGLVMDKFGRKNSFIVSIFADTSKRIERVTARVGGDIIFATKEIARRDSVKLSAGINEVIDKSDFTVENNNNVKEELRVKSNRLVQCVLDGK